MVFLNLREKGAFWANPNNTSKTSGLAHLEKHSHRARMAYYKLNELLDEFEAPKQKLPLPEPEGRVTLESVVVVPPLGETAVLKGVTLKIESGESVGIIGPSAAGKSSIAKTVTGVWKANNGYVRIDGAEIDHYNRDDLEYI